MSDPITRSGSPYTIPRDANRVPVVAGVSTADGKTPVPIEVDPNTGLLQVNASVNTGSGTVSTVINGQSTISVTNTAVQLSSHALVQGVTVEALSSNLNSIYVGPSSVTTSTGIELSPGSAVTFPASNTNILYINGTAGDAVSFIGG